MLAVAIAVVVRREMQHSAAVACAVGEVADCIAINALERVGVILALRYDRKADPSLFRKAEYVLELASTLNSWCFFLCHITAIHDLPTFSHRSNANFELCWLP